MGAGGEYCQSNSSQCVLLSAPRAQGQAECYHTQHLCHSSVSFCAEHTSTHTAQCVPGKGSHQCPPLQWNKHWKKGVGVFFPEWRWFRILAGWLVVLCVGFFERDMLKSYSRATKKMLSHNFSRRHGQPWEMSWMQRRVGIKVMKTFRKEK